MTFALNQFGVHSDRHPAIDDIEIECRTLCPYIVHRQCNENYSLNSMYCLLKMKALQIKYFDGWHLKVIEILNLSVCLL